MSNRAINETGLVNGIGYNLARLIAEDVDFEGYVNLIRVLAVRYSNYNRIDTEGLPQNKVAQIAAVQGFYNITVDYIERNEIFLGNDALLARARSDKEKLEIMIATHLVLAKAHALYFLGHGVSLPYHMEQVQLILDETKELESDIASLLAWEKLDKIVIDNLRKLKAASKRIYRDYRLVGVE